MSDGAKESVELAERIERGLSADMDADCGESEPVGKQLDSSGSGPSAPPAATQSIDDVPSCGQENDYRRAQSNGDTGISPRSQK